MKPTLSPENSISLGRGVALAPTSILGSVLHIDGSRSNMSQHAAKRGHPPGQSPKTSELTGLHALPAYMPSKLSHACRGGLRRQEGADSGARARASDLACYCLSGESFRASATCSDLP